MAKKPKTVFKVFDGAGNVVGEADSANEADAVVEDHRAAGRGPSYVREVPVDEPEASAEGAGQ